jgi:hypothetical protein
MKVLQYCHPLFLLELKEDEELTKQNVEDM